MLVPKLRFKREDGTSYPEWKMLPLNCVVEKDIIPVNNPQTNYTKLAIRSHGKGTFHKQIDDNGLAVDTMYLVKANHLIVNITFAWEQAIAITKPEDEGTFVSHRFPQFKFINDNIPDFYSYVILSPRIAYELELCSAGGAGRNRVLNISNFMNIEVARPVPEEQQKIADFLSTVDEVIAQSEAEVQNLEQQKKAAMQKIFSQEVRFKREDGTEYPEWGTKNISDICKPHARIGWQNLRTDEFLDEGDYYLVTGTDFLNGRVNFTTCHFIDRERFEQDKNIQIKNGDILITKDGTLGKIALVENMDKEGTLNAGVFVLQELDNNIYNLYLYQYLTAPYLLNFASDKATGGTIKHLNQGVLVQFPVPIPCLEEQQKIADFLSAYDEAISYAKQELEHWKQLKKGLLQQMFV